MPERDKSKWEQCIMCDKLTSPNGKYWEGWHAICSSKCLEHFIKQQMGECDCKNCNFYEGNK